MVKIVACIILILTIVFSINIQLKNAIVAIQVLSKPSARILVEEWVKGNIPKGSIIGIYSGSFTPNDNLFPVKSFSNMNEALSYQELKTEGVEYTIVDFYIANSSFVWWMGQPTDIGLKFWNKPNNLLSQSYTALAIRELLAKHTVQAYLPNWQAPGYNYLVTKIDPEPALEYRFLNKYNFHLDTQGWLKFNYFKQTQDLLTYSHDFGALTVSGETVSPTKKIRRIYARPGAMRWQSPQLESRSNYGYKITGKIKNGGDLKKDERNGFLRLDFYQNSPNSLESRSLASFVSERIYGKSEWHEVTVEGIAPKNSQFFSVSFQVDQGKNPFYLDEVEIFESKEQGVEKQQNKEYTIPDDDLFNPNDGGFL